MAFLASGCSCQPSLPQPDDEPEDTDTDTPDTAPVDTAPPPPCEAPEVEPNDAIGSATPLPMQAVGCGAWGQPGDTDYFTFVLEEEAWLEVRFVAKSIGSVGDGQIALYGADGALFTKEDDDGTTDATLTFPADPQRYDLQMVEQNGQGDAERYEYEVMALVTKPPLEWTRAEVEPNDGVATAEAVGQGDVVFGEMGKSADGDWYVVEVPAGKHTVSFDVDAYEFGSAGDYSLVLFDAALQPLPLGCGDCVTEGAPAVEGHDPLLEWTSDGNEVLYLRVYEAGGQIGAHTWYTLSVGLEGS